MTADLGSTERVALAGLSGRQRQVLVAVAEGATRAELAERLGVSEKTVDSHRRAVLRRLRLRNTADLTRFAIRHGLVTA